MERRDPFAKVGTVKPEAAEPLAEGAYREPEGARWPHRATPFPGPTFTPEEIAERRKIEPHMRAVSQERRDLSPIERWEIATERAKGA